MKIQADKSEFLERVRFENGLISVAHLESDRVGIEYFTRRIEPCLKTSNKVDGSNLTEKIWAVLSDRAIMKSPPEHLHGNDAKRYQEAITRSVESGEPIKLVFIALPFKTKNPLKTNRRLPDAGELLFLVRLLEINEAIKLVYPPGLNWLILAEGEAYRDLLTVSKEDAERYLTTIRSFVSQMNAESVIQIGDLARLCNSHDYFQGEMHRAREQMLDNYTRGELARSQHFQKIFWTMQNSFGFQTSDPEEIFTLAQNDFGSDATRQLGPQAQFHKQALEATIGYLAFNEAKNKVGRDGLGIVESTFPNHCYVSITPKPGRYAFHPLGSQSLYFPHHGVPLVEGKQQKRARIVPLVDVALRPTRHKVIYLIGDQEDKPFFYRQCKAPDAPPLGMYGGWSWG